MKNAIVLGMLIALAGCAAPVPVQVRSAPQLSPQELQALVAMQSRDVDVDVAAVFPRVLTVLLDAGYVIRSASKDLGQVSFYQQWNDPTQGGANITQEGTILFTATGAHKTNIRVTVTGGWQRLEVTGGTAKSTDTGMVGDVQLSASAEEYKRLLDLLETGLRGG